MNPYYQGLFLIDQFLRLMEEDGWVVYQVDDTEEEITVETVEQAIGAIKAVEGATVYFEDKNGSGGYWCAFIPENAEDALVDYGMYDSEWNLAVEGNWDYVADPKFVWTKIDEMQKHIDELNEGMAHYREQLAQLVPAGRA
jgi:hypothetical protein